VSEFTTRDCGLSIQHYKDANDDCVNDPGKTIAENYRCMIAHCEKVNYNIRYLKQILFLIL